MIVKSIRGSIQYNGTVYAEGMEFEIEEKHLAQIQDNVEVLPGKQEKSAKKSNKTTPDDPKQEAPSDKPENPDDPGQASLEKEVDYSKLKKAELLELAEQRNIDVPDKATNAEIIALLEGK